MIRFEHVCKYYFAQTSDLEKNINALVDINVVIKRGGFFVLFGPNGAGKTTFLKLITCQERPSAGKIFWGEQDLSKIKRKHIPFLRRKIGMIFQDFKLLYKKTIFENIAFVLSAIDLPKEVVFDRVCEALNKVDLIRKKNLYPYQLSHGERQKLCIARALVNNPEIILADEPMANLDMETQEELIQILSKTNEEGVTVVMATNNKKTDFNNISYQSLKLVGGKSKES
ncbi:ATP-binding cassette domain-containing protein [bacterium]|nr:ATP-binding cassette domain-containing protein [bacterium]